MSNRCANEHRRGYPACTGTNSRWPKFSTCRACAEATPWTPTPAKRWPYGDPDYAKPDSRRESNKPGRRI